MPARKQTMYRYGREFEYRTRDALREQGYFVLRSPQSKSPVDLVAIKAGVVLFLQCKRNGQLSPMGWNELFDLAQSVGAIPVLAATPKGRGIEYWRLLDRKDGIRRRQPLEPFDPGREGGIVCGSSSTGAIGGSESHGDG